MKRDSKRKKSKLVIALYTVAILMGAYTMLTIYSSYVYVASLVSQGFVVSDELLEVVQYFINNSLPYAFYSIATWGIGYIISKLNYICDDIKLRASEALVNEFIEEEVTVIEDEVSVSEDFQIAIEEK